MNITPLYELKDRLRAASIAGTSLISEDFRLKKAAENFKALEGASPVFKKVSELTAALVSDGCSDKGGTLLDAITLVDSVICTLGATGVSGEIKELDALGTSSEIVQAPYSKLSALIDSLTTSGGGQYNAFMEIKKNSPELFSDFRVKPLLVQGLGASYPEIADEVSKVIGNMGKEMLPLLKKGFDPKGKREMLRRMELIEQIGGADENAFYLEQLENSEKDIRKVLIYALRHDESNFDKLVELSKTEKGKMKKVALSAMLRFDRKEVKEFFEEMAKKKPADLPEIMYVASSEWSSGFTARLIDKLLVDDKGNKVTLSQAADTRNVKLKCKKDFFELAGALWGKWGAEIEKIYREFDNKDYTDTLDENLGESILETNNEGLKALAFELNAAKATKGCYVFSEAITRLISSKDDSSEWFAEQIKAPYKQCEKDKEAVDKSAIIKALRRIEFKDGKYYIRNGAYDPISEGWITNEWVGIVQFGKFRNLIECSSCITNERIEVVQSLKGAVTDALIQCPCWEYDCILSEFIDENDKELCGKTGRYFCDRLISFSGEGTYFLSFWSNGVKRCGMSNVKDLAVDYFKNIKDKCYTAWVESYINYIPGDDEYKLEEARSIIKIARQKKYSWFEIEKFEAWANATFNHA